MKREHREGVGMNARRIIFSGPTVRALLAGLKTQTRRVFLVPDPLGEKRAITSPSEEIQQWADGSFHYLSTAALSGPYPCPYGQPHDLLWVRETFGCPCHNSMQPVPGCELIYRATDEYDGDYPLSGWRQSIHMPRWASRLTLYLTGVRVERVQEITVRDAAAEGCEWPAGAEPDAQVMGGHEFANLWESINAKRGYPWDDNPWVWVLTFQVIRANVDDVLSNPEKYLIIA